MRIVEDFLDNMGKDALVKKNAKEIVVDDSQDNDERSFKDFDTRMSFLLYNDTEPESKYTELLENIFDSFVCVDDYLIKVVPQFLENWNETKRSVVIGLKVNPKSSLKSKVKLVWLMSKTLYKMNTSTLDVLDENLEFIDYMRMGDTIEIFKFNNTGLTTNIKEHIYKFARWMEDAFEIDQEDVFDYVYAFICKKVKIQDEIYYKAHPFS